MFKRNNFCLSAPAGTLSFRMNNKRNSRPLLVLISFYSLYIHKKSCTHFQALFLPAESDKPDR